MSLSFKHNIIIRRNPAHHADFLEASVYTWHGPNVYIYTCVRKRSPRHDAFSQAIIFLPRSTTSVLHGLRKRVRELMVSDMRWLPLWPWTIDHKCNASKNLFILHALYIHVLRERETLSVYNTYQLYGMKIRTRRFFLWRVVVYRRDKYRFSERSKVSSSVGACRYVERCSSRGMEGRVAMWKGVPPRAVVGWRGVSLCGGAFRREQS